MHKFESVRNFFSSQTLGNLWPPRQGVSLSPRGIREYGFLDLHLSCALGCSIPLSPTYANPPACARQSTNHSADGLVSAERSHRPRTRDMVSRNDRDDDAPQRPLLSILVPKAKWLPIAASPHLGEKCGSIIIHTCHNGVWYGPRGSASVQYPFRPSVLVASNTATSLTWADRSVVSGTGSAPTATRTA